MSDIVTLERWIDEVSDPDWIVVAKRLSANDTGATRSHQSGLYLPKPISFLIAPDLQHGENPKRDLRLRLVSHDQAAAPVMTYYNVSKDEVRITRFGGRAFATQDPESTGALLCLAFSRTSGEVLGWLATDLEQEGILESFVGAVLPGAIVWRSWSDGQPQLDEDIPAAVDACRPDVSELPDSWLERFPRGKELAEEAIRRANVDDVDPDRRLLRRFRCEYSLFQVVERAHLEPRIAEIHDVDSFLVLASSVRNRRMSRAGSSLQNHLSAVLDEEQVIYEPQVTTEPGSTADFIFPSAHAYAAAAPGDSAVRMLAAKTTLKDRWRQILDEAKKIPEKHVFTLAEGVSEQQYRAMAEAGLRLVVPRENITRFPAPVRNDLIDLSGFLELVR